MDTDAGMVSGTVVVTTAVSRPETLLVVVLVFVQAKKIRSNRQKPNILFIDASIRNAELLFPI